MKFYVAFILIVGTVGVLCDSGQRPSPSKTQVLYEVVPNTQEDLEFLLKFIADADVKVWTPLLHTGTPVQLLFPRSQLQHILDLLQTQGLAANLVDPRVKLSFSTGSNTHARAKPLKPISPPGEYNLRNDIYCPPSRMTNDCKDTPCLTYFEDASSICERWVSHAKDYSYKSETKDSCFLGLSRIVTCCKCNQG